MVELRQHLRQVGTAILFLSPMVLGGCSDLGVDLNGKVFDYLGVSPAAQAERRREPKLAERTPLVLPPAGYQLPEPGSGQSPTVALDDPDQLKVAEAKERQRLHEAYCRGDMQWKERAFAGSRNGTAGANMSPYGPCDGLFNANSFAESMKKKE